MTSFLCAEVRKLNGSLALALTFLAPLFPALMVLFAATTSNRSLHWGEIFGAFMLPIWAIFLLPMAITAFTTLLSQIEYQAAGWDHLLALPIFRPSIFLAKAAVTFANVAIMTMLAIAFSWLAAHIGGRIGGFPPAGSIDVQKLAQTAGTLSGAALFFAALQLWVSLRFSSFVVGMTAGIGGVMVGLAVAMTGTNRADWFPWALPVKTLSAPDPLPFVTLGIVGGIIVVAAMTIDLSRKSFR